MGTMMSSHYTHADHAARTVIAVYKGEPLGIRTQHVQARVGQTVCCARIVDAWNTPEGGEMWSLDLLGPVHGRMSLPAYKVRKCAHVDGKCTCVPFDLVPDHGAGSAGGACDSGAARAGASALPDGNHGETFPERAE
jgi:hypothetical protein